ncbi:MAG TPA: bifunctional methylenetetrahydrofolate dehydrogenase/methenyltetrahydrofolate cyclohydrolase FolD [Gemmataceae bacterium]|nr:bifunctional methylenetetrahydrofolate dehydrogenase/methenyltetrahydrofolate cyclohydrolase FolD [Gemmataceae bacterium]
MPAQLLDGKALAQTMQAEIASQAAEQIRGGGPQPGLAAVRVGVDPASEVYVNNKIKACKKAGIASFHYHLAGTTSQAELLQLIAKLNADPVVHGILVQLPLPKQIDTNEIISAIDPRKDVDGFHPENLGLLVAGSPRFVACTPLGVQQLLVRNNIDTTGAKVTILGRSLTVGKPLALLLAAKGPGGDATVTIAHSKSRDLPELAGSADILIAAMGQAHFVTAAMVKPGAVVIDVGITRRSDGKLAGDVDFDAVLPIARAITPVPGGVGPMTITMLLHNTLLASRLS